MTHEGGYDRPFVLWLSLAQLISWGSVFYTFALIMVPVERELGLSRAQSSFAFSLALFAEGLFAYVVGRWIDRGRERAVMTCGSVVLALALAAHSQVRSIEAFYVVWLALGAGLAATLYTPVFAVVTRRFPTGFRRAIITMTFLGGLASTVFIPLTDRLIDAFGWRHALLVLAAINLLVCAPLHAIVLRGAPVRVPSKTGSATASPRALLLSTPFLLIGLFVVCMMGLTAALPPHMITLLREAGLGEQWAIAIPASIGIIQVFGRLLLFFFEHRFDIHLANRLIPCLLPISVLVLLVGAESPTVALAFVLLYGLGNGMITIVKGTAIAQYVSRDHVASLNGALGLPSAVARALAPLALGLLWTPQAGYRWGLALLLVMGVGSAWALWQAQRHSLIREDPAAGR